MIAPCTCCMRTSHPAVLSPAMLQIAIVGASSEKVPPWINGKRLPKVVCSNVVMPETKNIVEINAASATGSEPMPSASFRINGIATVDPNIVR